MADVFLTPEALLDISEIYSVLLESGGPSGYAQARLDELEARLTTLGKPGELFGYPGELSIFGNKRIHEVQDMPWRIFYRMEGETVVVLGVFERQRSMQSLLYERLVRP